MSLRDLYERLEGDRFTYTQQDRPYLNTSNKIVRSHEIISLRSQTPTEEVHIIGRPENSTSVIYSGRPKTMRQTLQEIGLANSTPNNLGERIFYDFRNHLKNMSGRDVSLETEITKGSEQELELILKRLSNYYDTTNPSNVSYSSSLGALLR